MKALMKIGPQAGLELTDVPEPQITRGNDVKIRVMRAGICGTDLHIHAWDASAESMCDTLPFIPGHEFYGEVVEIGEDVMDVQVGDRVSGEGHVVCGLCRNCRAGRRHMCRRSRSIGVQRNGAFAEYVVIPNENTWVHSTAGENSIITPELGAVFDPLGNAVHTALTFPLVGEDVLVTGAGPIGLMAAAVARHAGARYIAITDVAQHRLDMAEAAGADLAINVENTTVASALQSLGLREGFDVGLETSGSPLAMRDHIENLNHGGKISLLGLPAKNFEIDWTTVITRMLTIKGIYGREMFETWYAMTSMLQTSDLFRQRVLATVTDVLPASQWEKGYDMARSAAAGKIVLDWENI